MVNSLKPCELFFLMWKFDAAAAADDDDDDDDLFYS